MADMWNGDRISNMGDSHLVNTLRYLERTAKQVLSNARGTTIDFSKIAFFETTREYMYRETEYLRSVEPVDYVEHSEQYKNLQKERLRRQIDYRTNFQSSEDRGHTDECWRESKLDDGFCECEGREDMPRPKKIDKVRLNLELTGEVNNQLEWLLINSGAETRTEVIKNALRLYNLAMRIDGKGGKILLESKDGEQIQLMLV